MRQREHPPDLYPSAASSRTPADGVRHGPRKLLAVITRGMADAALKASLRGTKKWEGWGKIAKLGRRDAGSPRELP